jgi:hypothetical protein
LARQLALVYIENVKGAKLRKTQVKSTRVNTFFFAA